MPAKPRVHELARELGLPASSLLSWLNDNGEFVKSASSTLEPAVARKVREAFPAQAAAGADVPPPARPKPAVHNWGAAEWRQAAALAPSVESTLRVVCKLHQRAAVFDSDGALTAPARVPLRKLRPAVLAAALGPLLGALHVRIEAEEAASGVEGAEARLAADPEVGPALAALAACRLDFDPAFLPSQAPTTDDDDEHAAIDAEAGTPAEEEEDAAGLRDQLEALTLLHPKVIAAADSTLQDALAGRPSDLQQLLLLMRWSTGLTQLADTLDAPPETVTLDSLRAAVEAAEAAAAPTELEVLTSQLHMLATAVPSSGAAPVLQPLLDAFATLDVATLDEAAVAAYQSLERLLTSEAWDATEADLSLVSGRFGARVMAIAASEVLHPARGTAPAPQSPLPAVEGDAAAAPSAAQDDDKQTSAARVEVSPVPAPAEPVADIPTARRPDPEATTAAVDPPEAPALAEVLPEPTTATEAPTPSEDSQPSDHGQATPPTPATPATAAATAGSPAQSGLSPALTAAVLEGPPALAYWHSVATDAVPLVQTLLQVLALSDWITADGDETSLLVRDLLATIDPDEASIDPTTIKLAAAAAARAALRIPFSPAGDLLNETCALMQEEPAYLQTVRQAATRGVELHSLQEQNRKSLPELIAARDTALATLREHVEVAAQRRTRMARSTNIWRQLLTGHGRLGKVILRTLQAPHDLEPADTLLRALRDVRDVDKMLDELDAQRNPIAARKNKIIAGARQDLRDLTTGLLDALQGYVDAARAVTARERHSANDSPEALELLTQAVSTAPARREPADPGDHCLEETRTWIHNVLQRRVALPTTPVPPAQALSRVLSTCYEVARDAEGAVEPSSVTIEALAQATTRLPEDAYDGFVARDDHVGVEQLLDALRAEGHESTAARLAERQRDDLKISRERLRKLLAETDRTLSLALSTALLSESESTALGAEVERIRADQAVNFVASRQDLQRIIDHVSTARATALEQAREQLRSAKAPQPVTDRISRLLDVGDLVNAQEFLSQVAAGAQELPSEAAADETLAEFWPAFPRETEKAAQAGDPGVAEAAWLLDLASQRHAVAGLAVTPQDASPAISEGLRAWAALTVDKRKTGYEDHLKAVLQMLGLEMTSFDKKEKHQRQRWWTTVKAARVGQALVAAYGSGSNGQYQVMLCWERLPAERLLQEVSERSPSPPPIVLYFQTLSARERRALADRSRPNNKNVSAVVVDHATVAFLATRRDPAFHTTLGVTLPFTSINPYTPFVLGDVPREVFYGRKQELRRVQDPNDALFVYGGRQLGKSSLLKTAMHEFRDSDPKWRSLYVDLKAEGVGEWRQPDDIWQVLLPQLVDAGVVEARVSPKAPPDVVVSSIRRWLDADPDRRFLLLLDEADAFLETDARSKPGAVGEARFVNVYRLKSLMDGTGRRFKPVFAGLHQVQRFHTTSNGPMAHVGAEIPIGPLPPAEAFKLVVKPLAAIGYNFTTPDAVWRLLTYTNYQASLIQLFCDALVRKLFKKNLAGEAPPTSVDGDLVDEVYAEKDLRDQIATRFEWTINLDNRYRVIAYATAWLSLNGPTQLFSPLTMHDECATFWPTGFNDLSLDDFVAYLEEMVGLGVLVRTPENHYGIRSPNVIRLLGSPEEIERRLLESDKLELSRPFDPALYRRALNGDPDVRSPLSEVQAKHVLEVPGVVHLVVGTTALGLDRVSQALAGAAGEEVTVQVCDTAGLPAVLTALARQRTGRHHVLVDDPHADPDTVLAALPRLLQQASAGDLLTASWLTPVDAQWLPAAEAGLGAGLHRTPLQLWNDDALQAWAPECGYPLVSASDRADLLEATGGWPSVIEAASAAARAGETTTRAREQALAAVCQDDGRAFLTSVGLGGDPEADRVAEVVANWSDELQFGEIADLVDIPHDELLPVVERLVAMAVLRRTATGDCYRVNPLVARAMQPDR